jgi:hypothetical protein
LKTRLISVTVSGISPGSSGGSSLGEVGARARVLVRERANAAVVAQTASAAMAMARCRVRAV